MRLFRVTHRARALATVGATAGVVAGFATFSVATGAVGSGTSTPRAVFDVTHSPPLLTVSGEDAELVYDVHCAAPGVEDPEAGCDVAGTAFVRAGNETAFQAVPLLRDRSAGQMIARVPAALSEADAFEYYAELDSDMAESAITLPPGGPTAPTVSRRLGEAVPVVDLGRHPFGNARRAGERVAHASWGDGPANAGLEAGRNLGPIGASAFDVDTAGNVTILDHAHRRLLRWAKGGRSPSQVPVSINGTIADLAVSDDGSLYVLETTSRDGRTPLVRRFDDAGRELEAIESAERGPAQIRIGPDGPLVLQRPSHQWMPVSVGGIPASQAVQRRSARSGRTLRSGAEVVMLRQDRELRVALVARGSIARAWRVTSETPIGEVQLAEPVDGRFVVVLRVYDDRSDEFVILLLDRHGLVSRTTLDSSDWAETAPLGRFRVVGRSLYRLGSTPAGVFVERFDLEVR